MAHDCWDCSGVCYCDMDDTWGLPIPKDCSHVCRDSFDGDDYEDDESEQDDDDEEPAI